MRTLATAAFAAVFIAGPATAQDISRDLDRIFAWVTPGSPGCVVGVSQRGVVVGHRAYGLADVERGVPLTLETPFDIGSTQKQFVAASVLLLVQDGRLALSDDIRGYVPELPDYGHTITIDHLLTHTSGIRDWVWLSQATGGSEEALTLILRQRGLNFAPGEEWAYSNSGYVLLKEIVARVSGQSFADFTRARLFEPLGMRSTRYVPDISEVPNHALAYERNGEGWKVDMMLGAERGGGAIVSTAGDLLVWNEALTARRLGALVSEKVQEPARLANGRVLAYARGLILDAEGEREIVWHSGSAAAYKSMLARLPRQNLSFAILCNAGEAASRANSERHIVDLFVTSPRGPGATAGAPAAAPGTDAARDLAGRAGLFFSDRTGEPLRLAVGDGRLRIAGGPALVALGDGRFRAASRSTGFMSNDEFELHFTSADEFVLTSMERQATRYHRARPWAPTAEELATLAGLYETDEVGALELAPTATGLVGRLNGSQPIELQPVHPDVFQRGAMTLRFRRDAAGTLIGLDLSNPVARAVHFPRRSGLRTR